MCVSLVQYQVFLLSSCQHPSKKYLFLNLKKLQKKQRKAASFKASAIAVENPISRSYKTNKKDARFKASAIAVEKPNFLEH